MMKKVKFLLLCLLCVVAADAQNTRAGRLRTRYITPTADDSNRVWIMAHRGAWDEVSPESSIGAYNNAVTYGFEILELDVRFSSPYKIENGVQVADTEGTYREIILQHDKSDKRSDETDGNWTQTFGLYKYDPSQTFTDKAKKKNKSNGLKFVMMDKMVPYRADGINCIDGPGQTHPVLLKLDSTESTSRMVHFPHNATTANADFLAFYNAVKDKILLNFDKLATSRDFQETYDIMSTNGLLDQCIFKAKGVTGYSMVKNLFGNKNLSTVMYTPIFTKYDFTSEATGTLVQLATNAEKLQMAKDSIATLIAAANAGNIIFPGCEIVYETVDTNDENYGWLPSLADYVKNTLHKRVVQFSTNLENKQGAWSGNGNFWSGLVGIEVNYWSWLFNQPNNPDMNRVRASVFVGDKPLEFRSYLTSLGYNQAPIQ